MMQGSEPRFREVAELLDRYTPVPSTAPAWHEIDRRSRTRVRRVLLAAAIALAVAAPALAFSDSVRTLVGLGHPEPVMERATLILSAPVGNGFWAHAWTSPSTSGGQCDFVTRDRRSNVGSPANSDGGYMCSEDDGGERLTRATPEQPLTLGLSIGRRPENGDPARWVPPIVSGAVLPSLGATRVAVVWNGGSLTLRLRDNYFLGGSPLLYLPPFERFPFTVVAYDAEGRNVAQKRLDSPSLRLMNGWREYTPAYNKWKRGREASPVTGREWRAVIDDWYDNGEFDRAHRCAAVREAISRLPSSMRNYSSVIEDLRAYAAPSGRLRSTSRCSA